MSRSTMSDEIVLDAARRRCLVLLLASGAAPASWAFSLKPADASAALRTALEQGARAAIGQLGVADGFLGNDALRIPLPGWLEKAGELLRTFGQGHRVDELVTSMNRAAEAAVPEAEPLLLGAIKSMSITDAKKIITGGETSVTEFFSDKTREPISAKFLPIITRATEKVDLAAKANRLIEQASRFGLVGESQTIEQHVNGRAVNALYSVIGEKEKQIRQDPAGTGSAILKKVFGALK